MLTYGASYAIFEDQIPRREPEYYPRTTRTRSRSGTTERTTITPFAPPDEQRTIQRQFREQEINRNAAENYQRAREDIERAAGQAREQIGQGVDQVRQGLENLFNKKEKKKN